MHKCHYFDELLIEKKIFKGALFLNKAAKEENDIYEQNTWIFSENN